MDVLSILMGRIELKNNSTKDMLPMPEKKVDITDKEIDYARKIARGFYEKYRHSPWMKVMAEEDFIHEAVVGLVQAAYSYNGEIPFLIYASFRIKGAIIDMLRKRDLIRVSQENKQRCKKLQEAAAALEMNGKPASDENLSKAMNIPVSEVQKIRTYRVLYSYLDAGVPGDDDDSKTSLDLPSEETDPERKLMREQVQWIVKKCLKNTLKPKERSIFNLILVKNKTLKDVAASIGCTHQNIWNILTHAKEKVKNCLMQHDITKFDISTLFGGAADNG